MSKTDRDGTVLKCFKNSGFVKRDYECTNIVACTAHHGASVEAEYVESDFGVLIGLTHLYTVRDIAYYGYL